MARRYFNIDSVDTPCISV